MIQLISYPQKQLSDASYCRWNGAYAPAVFEFERKDLFYNELGEAINYGITTTSVRDNLFIRLTWSTFGYSYTDEEVQNLIGTKVLLMDSANYRGYHTVLSITALGILTATEYTVFEGFGYFNTDVLRENHYIEIQLYKYTDLIYTLVDENIRIRSNIDGKAKFSPSKWLKSYLNTQSDNDLSVANKRDLSLGGGYVIKYREVYTGSNNEFSDYTDVFYFTGFAPELGEANNMLDYYMGGGEQGKFLSGFEEPTWFKDYPFDLQFIYDPQETDYSLQRIDREYNQSLTEIATQLDETQAEAINRMRVRDMAVSKQQVWLDKNIVIDEGIYVERSYVEETYVR